MNEFESTINTLARSNQSQVVLTRVSFGLSGNFSCEVTADAPSFATSIVSNTMEVVALPPSLPIIHTDKHYYGPGDVLYANCTSGPSRPPSDLMFFLNDAPYPADAHQVHPAPEGLFRSEIYGSIQLWPAHYERGAPILRCQAKIGDLYRDDAAVALYSGNSHPKIERVYTIEYDLINYSCFVNFFHIFVTVTSPGSAGSLQVCQFLLLLQIIVWANNT
ncbi:hypothetical protein HF086_016406 [Spodoptera exigua]|uniref:Beat protein n=1 Tax=Spodoptera exigua TaxID=7107 RepID=A0A922SS03_SPOEX|nr:hypothetical protein HF086_016406 [Spodoptera exigua]